MKKLVYAKVYPLNKNAYGICVNKEFEEEIKQIFNGYKYKIKFRYFSESYLFEDVSDNSLEIQYDDYTISKVDFWYDVLTVLIEHGYELIGKVKSRYEWYKSKIEEEKQEQLKRLTEQEEIQKAIAEKQANTILWCWENGCETTLTACKKCRFTNRGISCEPKRAVIEEKDGKQYVRIIK
jgi:hypothetical protein